MSDIHPVIWFFQLFIFLLGVAVGHSVLIYRTYREENRKREAELALLEKRSDIMSQGKQIAKDLEDALYNARVRQEIDDILRKS